MPKKVTQEQFITKVKEVHGNKFDYSQVIYLCSSEKVIIICPHHGKFLQRPSNHLLGIGCPGCKGDATKKRLLSNTKEFIIKAQEKHNNRYNYDNTIYSHNLTPVSITCLKHGEFKQSPATHLKGGGCPKCGRERIAAAKKYSTKTIIEKFKDVHGMKFSYDDFEYTGFSVPSIITCPEHGGFKQSPANHLKGQGCRKCINWNSIGFTRSGWIQKYPQNSILYVLLCSNSTESFIKIGITGVSIKKRLYQIPYDYKILHTFNTKSDTVFDLEIQLHRMFKKHRYEPKINFGGRTECFNIDIYEEVNVFFFNF